MDSNPFDQFDPQDDETTAVANPFDQFDVPEETSVEPSQLVTPDDSNGQLTGYDNGAEVIPVENPLPPLPEGMPVSSGSQWTDYQNARSKINQPVETPEAVLADQAVINTDKKRGVLDAQPSNKIETLQSKSDLYDPIDNKEEYAPVKDWESKIGYNLGHIKLPEWTGGSEYSFSGKTPPEVEELRKKKATEKEDKYFTTGEEDSFMGVPIRTQEKRENNPIHDPNIHDANDPRSQAMISTRYIVDGPDANTIQRMAYQIGQNIVGGIGDTIMGQGFTGEGWVGKKMPETVPNVTGEKFTTDVVTFALGGAMADKAMHAGAQTAMKLARNMSPEAKTLIQTTYQETLAATGSEKTARWAANQAGNGVVFGTGLGLRAASLPGVGLGANLGRSAGLGIGEAAVAPNDATGAVVDPKFLQETFGFSKQAADDASFLLDSPVMSSTLATFGGIWNTAVQRGFKPAFGGIRNMNPFQVLDLSRLSMADKQAGVAFLAWLDPEMMRAAPEDLIHKQKLLADAIQRNGQKQMKLMEAGGDVELDTATAARETMRDYYSSSYVYMKAAMDAKKPGSFEAWVANKANETSERLFQLRTSIQSEDTSGRAMDQMKNMMHDASEGVNPKGLRFAEGETSKLAEDQIVKPLTEKNLKVVDAQADLDKVKLAQQRGMVDHPELGPLLEQNDHTLGGNKARQDIVEKKITPDLLAAQDTMQRDSSEAWAKVANLPGKTVPDRMVKILENSDKDMNVQRLQQMITDDPSVHNIYSNVRKRAIDLRDYYRSTKHPNTEAFENLLADIDGPQLDNIAKTGGKDAPAIAENAKKEWADYQNAFYGPNTSAFRQISEEGEKMIKSQDSRVKQGTGDFRVKASQFVNNLLSTNEHRVYSQDLKAAATAGGQPQVAEHIDEFLMSKALSNMSDHIAKGGKQDVASLRNGLADVINEMRHSKNPNVAMFERVEKHLTDLAARGDASGEILKKVEKEAADYQSTVQDNILHNFLIRTEGGLEGVSPSDVGKNLKTMFTGKNAETKMTKLMEKADALGSAGDVIKESAQGSFMRHLAGKITSESKMGMLAPHQKFAKRANEGAIEKIFDPDSADFAVIKTIFRDKPEVVDQLVKFADLYAAASRKTPHTDSGTLLGKIPRSEDPAQAAQTLVTFMLGQLNPTATKVKRITTPMTIESLDQVRKRRLDLLDTIMESPDKFAELTRSIAEGNVRDEQKRWVAKALRRGAFRAYMSNEDVGVLPAMYKTEETVMNGLGDLSDGKMPGLGVLKYGAKTLGDFAVSAHGPLSLK
jgi:hypothetical protein